MRRPALLVSNAAFLFLVFSPAFAAVTKRQQHEEAFQRWLHDVARSRREEGHAHETPKEEEKPATVQQCVDENVIQTERLLGERNHSQPAQSARPNILFVLSDQQRYSHDGFHNGDGGVGGATAAAAGRGLALPHLKRLSDEGVRFTAAYTTAPICSPARASLAIGRQHHEVLGYTKERNMLFGPPAQYTTIYSTLALAGYHTMTCGKDDLQKAQVT